MPSETERGGLGLVKKKRIGELWIALGLHFCSCEENL